MSPSTSKDIHEADITEGGDEVQEPISTTKDMDMAEEANPTEENTETSGMKKRKKKKDGDKEALEHKTTEEQTNTSGIAKKKKNAKVE